MDRCSLEKPAVTRGKVRELTAAADAFLWDPRSRLKVMPEFVSDGLVCYEPAVARSFGGAIDYAVLVKTPSRKGKRDTGVPFVQKRSVVGAWCGESPSWCIQHPAGSPVLRPRT